MKYIGYHIKSNYFNLEEKKLFPGPLEKEEAIASINLFLKDFFAGEIYLISEEGYTDKNPIQ